MITLSFTENDQLPGTLVAHRPDCPVAEQHRKDGRLICTMIFGTPPSLPDAECHECLKAASDRRGCR